MGILFRAMMSMMIRRYQKLSICSYRRTALFSATTLESAFLQHPAAEQVDGMAVPCVGPKAQRTCTFHTSEPVKYCFPSTIDRNTLSQKSSHFRAETRIPEYPEYPRCLSRLDLLTAILGIPYFQDHIPAILGIPLICSSTFTRWPIHSSTSHFLASGHRPLGMACQ